MTAIQVFQVCTVNMDDGRQVPLSVGRYVVVPDGQIVHPGEVAQSVAAHPWCQLHSEPEEDGDAVDLTPEQVVEQAATRKRGRPAKAAPAPEPAPEAPAPEAAAPAEAPADAGAPETDAAQ